ncbi:MAG: hypothetical protein JNL74_20660, partial [Fibrobacteres bacterium]|nr:hypothetical protein [Fibrobacterota bacterium]
TLIYIVNNTPSVAITSPRADSVISGTAVVLFTAAAVAPATIASTAISIDGGAFRATSAATSDTIDTQSLTDGDHTVQIKAIDNNGKSALSSTLKFVVRNMPSVVITSPKADSVISGTAVVLFTATAVSPATIASAAISVDGGAFRATSAATSDTIDTQSLTDGDHTVQIKATDNNGKSALSTTLKFVVRNMPSVAITSPRADSVISGTAVVLFTATAVSPATIASAAISVDGGAFRATSAATSDTIDTQSLTDGDHTVQIKATDNNGKSSLSSTLKFVVRNMPTVTITSPRADSVISGTAVVLFTASAVSPATIALTAISVDGGAFRSTSTVSSDTIDTQSLTDGDHTVQIKVTDNNGKTANSVVLKFVVANRPSVIVTAPAADARLSGTVVALFTATAVSPAVIESTWISIDGGLYRATSTNISDTIDTRLFAEGTHYFRIKTSDNNGKEAISEVRKFNINNLPTVSLSYPTAGSVLSGIDTVRFTAVPISPALIESTWMSIDGGSWRATTSPTVCVLNTVDLVDGTHSVQIKARDNNGKTDYSSRVNLITRNAPTVAITYPAAGQYVSGTVTVRFTSQFVAPAVLDTIEVSINGGLYVAASTESTYVWDTRTLNDVEHSIKVRVRDDRGKLGESEILLVKADNRAPVVTDAKLNYGTYSAVTASGRISFSATVFDRESSLMGSGVILRVPALSQDSVLLNDNGTNGDTISGDHIFTTALVPTGLTSGPIPYSITATDLLGNRVTINDTFYYDAVPPSITINVLPIAVNGSSQLNGFVYVDNIELSIAYKDLNSGILSGKLTITDSTGSVLLPESPMTIPATDTLLIRTVKLREGVNFISATVTDKAGNSSSATSRLTFVPPKVISTVGSAGGKVINPNGTSIDIPAGALFEPAAITIIRIERNELPEPEKSGIHLIGPAYVFGPDGLIFKKDVTISFSYTKADLDPDRDGMSNYAAESLAVYFLENGKWIIAGDAVTDTLSKLVQVQANHFTIYAIGTRAEAPMKTKSYWTKNPILRTEQSSFVYELPEGGSVSLSIFDAAGDLVRILIPENTNRASGSYSVKWDGANSSNRYCGTGLYFYLFKAVTPSETTRIKKPVAIINR